jgi:GH15 family glucan-1,4-alpha-glucosidase
LTNQISENSSPGIGDYGFIADCHSVALISSRGSIDWCCMPRVDSPSFLGRLLDWENGGYCHLAPDTDFVTSRRYLDDTLILETIFRTDSGEARLLDCYTMHVSDLHRPYQQILRVLEGIRGQVRFILKLFVRFDYGSTKPWLRRIHNRCFHAFGGSDSLLLSGDFDLETHGPHILRSSCEITAGQKRRLAIGYHKPENLHDGLVETPETSELDRRLEETRQWWQEWVSKGKIAGPYAKELRRSALVLKGLCNVQTGSMAAAATTSLPEVPGGSRNWDYRFTWVRDSSFAMRSLAELNFKEETNYFRKFIERSTASSVNELQVLYGMGGERRLVEFELKHMSGYKGAKPVRIGNAAYEQHQADLYGWILHLSWSWHTRGHTPEKDYWDFLVELANQAAEDWRTPGRGFWEMRGNPRHFVVSKAMCWQALDCAAKLAKDIAEENYVERWLETREEIRRDVEKHGYNAKRGVFIQAYDYPVMDSSLLLLPVTGFIGFKDERMIRTVDAVWQDLEEDGLLLRYPRGNDGMAGEEGAFISCSFWLAECLARQDRIEEARQVFQRALETGNDLGLFSEEYDTRSQNLLGNFPQALTHLSLIAAGVALGEVQLPRVSKETNDNYEMRSCANLAKAAPPPMSGLIANSRAITSFNRTS